MESMVKAEEPSWDCMRGRMSFSDLPPGVT